ncbi:hypothetical protein NL64_18965 [Pseudomonas fluorescens]|uniref:hypothetical protein n=1 Tax=Pseudomonas fluorescens TaxID=294 RepID=UPI00054C4412|nr:hypothetical protein [Pseudomonas fluorescens]KII30208.1 hypothetical protein NL64_18965 [Pseudomonas fluorescens]
MEKLYKFKEFITGKDANSWLQKLTSTPISGMDFAQLWYDGHIDVYLSCLGAKGYLNTPGEATETTEVIGGGVARVDEGWRFTQFEGVWVVGTLRDRGEEEVLWFATINPEMRTPLFKPSDIQAFADVMNGTANQATELERLREDLERERASNAELQRQLKITEGVCEVAEREADELRSQWQTSEMVDHLAREELKEKHQAELAKLRAEEDKPFDKRSRRTIEKLIYVLAMEGKYSLEKPYSDAEDIQKAASAIGVMSPGTTDTIVKYLEAAAARIAQDRKDASA